MHKDTCYTDFFQETQASFFIAIVAIRSIKMLGLDMIHGNDLKKVLSHNVGNAHKDETWN